MDRVICTEAHTLRRRALWFREFARLGAPEERNHQNALADTLEREADEAEIRTAAQVLP